MYAPIYKLPVGTMIEYLGWRGVVVKQFGKQRGTNCCSLDNNCIIEFAEEGALKKWLINDDPKRMHKNYWYYSYKAMVKVVKP